MTWPLNVPSIPNHSMIALPQLLLQHTEPWKDGTGIFSSLHLWKIRTFRESPAVLLVGIPCWCSTHCEREGRVSGNGRVASRGCLGLGKTRVKQQPRSRFPGASLVLQKLSTLLRHFCQSEKGKGRGQNRNHMVLVESTSSTPSHFPGAPSTASPQKDLSSSSPEAPTYPGGARRPPAMSTPG